MNLLYALVCTVLLAPPPQYKPGTAVFVQDGFVHKQIEKVTGSDMSHAAIVFYDNGEPWVYEATLPVVKRTPLKEWQKMHAEKSKKNGSKLHYIEPNNPYTDEQIDRMKIYADAQLGRKYRLRGFWKNKEVKGLHCSQYVGDIISQSGRIHSDHWKESPGSLYEKCKEL